MNNVFYVVTSFFLKNLNTCISECISRIYGIFKSTYINVYESLIYETLYNVFMLYRVSIKNKAHVNFSCVKYT